MKEKLKSALEKLDLGMNDAGASELRELAPKMPALNEVIEKLDYGMNDQGADLLREIVDSM